MWLSFALACPCIPAFVNIQHGVINCHCLVPVRARERKFHAVCIGPVNSKLLVLLWVPLPSIYFSLNLKNQNYRYIAVVTEWTCRWDWISQLGEPLLSNAINGVVRCVSVFRFSNLSPTRVVKFGIIRKQWYCWIIDWFMHFWSSLQLTISLPVVCNTVQYSRTVCRSSL